MGSYFYEVDIWDSGSHRHESRRIEIRFFPTRRQAEQYVSDKLPAIGRHMVNEVTARVARVLGHPHMGRLELAEHLANNHETDHAKKYMYSGDRFFVAEIQDEKFIWVPVDLPPPTPEAHPDKRFEW